MHEPGATGDWKDFCLPLLKSPELEPCYRNEFRRRDFWEDHFNKDILQQILDWKYNPQPGCHYTVVKDHFQQKIRLKVVCTMCRCDLKGFDVFISHNNGKNHKRIVQIKMFSAAEVIKSCFRSLREERMCFPEGTLEYMIDTDQKPVVGVSFVFKKFLKNEDAFTCDLCKTFGLRVLPMLEHLESSQHALKYLLVKFQIKAENQELKSLCEKVMETEGRINHLIHDTGLHCDVLPNHKEIPIEKKKPETMCKSTGKVVMKNVETQLDDAPHTLIDSLSNLPKLYVKEVFNDPNNWNFILYCLFALEMRLAKYFISKNKLENFGYSKKIYFYLGRMHVYEQCIDPED